MNLIYVQNVCVAWWNPINGEPKVSTFENCVDQSMTQGLMMGTYDCDRADNVALCESEYFDC